MPAQARQSLTIRNPERIVYPLVGFTKAQVVDFYERIAPHLLPHLQDHPVTLKRYPDEAGGQFFYEKDAPAFTPAWVKTFAVPRRSGEGDIHYIVINDAPTLRWAASVGTLEIHPFLARVPDVQCPAAIVFDLDPGPPADILDCARVALLLRETLGRFGLESFVKVSGSKGLQSYVPLNTPTTYAITQPFARTVAELLAREHPQMIVAEMEKAQRRGRVFIDWSQNADYKTTVAVYSLRAKRRHPYVSMPVAWDELQHALNAHDAALLFFVADAALARVERVGDLFAPVLPLRQQLPENFTHALGPAKARQARTGPRAAMQGGRRRFYIQGKSRPKPNGGATNGGPRATRHGQPSPEQRRRIRLRSTG